MLHYFFMHQESYDLVRTDVHNIQPDTKKLVEFVANIDFAKTILINRSFTAWKTVNTDMDKINMLTYKSPGIHTYYRSPRHSNGDK